MQCPFCQQDMTSIDNVNVDSETPPPRQSMVWVCRNCPLEVRVMAEKDTETERHWIAKHTSIFLYHKDKRYCLHWDHIKKSFDIRDCSASSGLGIILQTKVQPTSITPDNAYDKFLTYLTFS